MKRIRFGVDWVKWGKDVDDERILWEGSKGEILDLSAGVDDGVCSFDWFGIEVEISLVGRFFFFFLFRHYTVFQRIEKLCWKITNDLRKKKQGVHNTFL